MVESVFCVFYNELNEKIIVLDVDSATTMIINTETHTCKDYDDMDSLMKGIQSEYYSKHPFTVNEKFKGSFTSLCKDCKEVLTKDFIIDLLSNIEYEGD